MNAHARYQGIVMLFTSILLCVHLGACGWGAILDPCSAFFDEEPFKSWDYFSEVNDDLVSRHPRLGWQCRHDNILNVYVQALHISAGMLIGVDKASMAGYFAGGGENERLLEEVTKHAELLTDTAESAAADPFGARIRALRLELLQARYPLILATEDALGCAEEAG